MRILGVPLVSSRFLGVRSALSLSVLAVSFALLGCDSSTGGVDSGRDATDGGDGGSAANDGGVDAGTDGGADSGPNGDPSNVYPAPHPALPQVVDLGGPVLASPQFIPVTFSNDDATVVAALDDFLQRVGTTAYFAANTSEYGVGAAAAGPAVPLSEMAPAAIDDSAIQTWLAGKLNTDDPAFPVAGANTLFVLIYPAGTTVTTNGTTTGCQAFGSYHSDVVLDGAHAAAKVPYVVLPRCANFSGLTGTEAATAALSNALLNAVTDPQPLEAPAWAEADPAHLAWAAALQGGEICTLCAQELASFSPLTEIPYTAQRCWSNHSAAAGHDPCVPVPTGVSYFNAIPVLPDMLSLPGGGSTAGIQIPKGTSRTLAVDLFSDAATVGPISVAAFDYAATTMGGAPVLTLSLDSASGLNGQHLNLTITMPQGTIQPALFLLSSTVGGVSHYSIGLAGN